MDFKTQKLTVVELSNEEAAALMRFAENFFIASNNGQVRFEDDDEHEKQCVTCNCISVMDEISRHVRKLKTGKSIKATFRVQEMEAIEHYMDYAAGAVRHWVQEKQQGEWKLLDQETLSTVQGLRMKFKRLHENYAYHYTEQDFKDAGRNNG